jgi:pyruvate/2-oxoglutarate dehydrogenase complex dihydrolipoamide dehydrogenase (E3) component
MAEVLRPDICVIGAGSGGLTVAAAAAAFGVPVVLIEKGKMGGDCLNTGCLSTNRTISPNRFAGLASFKGKLRNAVAPVQPCRRYSRAKIR